MNRKEKAQQFLDDVEMRRGLMEFLWQFTEDAQDKTPRPLSLMGDEQVKRELKRILS